MKKLLVIASLALGVIAFTSATAEARPYSSYGHSHGYRGSSSCGKSYHHYPSYRYPSHRSSSFYFSFRSSSPSYRYYRPCPPPPVYRPCYPVPRYYNPCR